MAAPPTVAVERVGRGHGSRLPALLAALAMAAGAALFPGVPSSTGRAPTVAAGDGACAAYPAPLIGATPWYLRRIRLDQLWHYGRGGGVRVAVIDTGVDDRNPQLRQAVDTRDGFDLIDPGGNGTLDDSGHGTEVAGIIAARPEPGVGIVGLAPQATVIPVRQNDAEGRGTAAGLATAIVRATHAGAEVINISEDTENGSTAALAAAVRYALRRNIVVVAAAGNDGASGARTTYPAAYPGVLAVGASGRDAEPAPFSQAGPFVGVLAPGVDIVSTVPGGGQCVDDGTSFAAPYAAAVAALLRARHPDWTEQQIVARIEQTAVRRGPGRTDAAGWGVVDPVRALSDADPPTDAPVPGSEAPRQVDGARPVPLDAGRATRRSAVRLAGYLLACGALAVVVIAGGAALVRGSGRRGHAPRRSTGRNAAGHSPW